MASPRIRLNPQQTEDFTALCDVGQVKLEAVLASLEGAERPLISTAQLRERAAAIVGPRHARALVRQLIAFAIGARRMAFSSDITEAISDALKERNWDEERQKSWDEIKSTFWRLVSQRHIRHAAKAYDLSFDYANIFDHMRIVTDLRPVFDDDHATLVGGIVRHVMRLSYSSVGDETSLSIVLDRKDIEDIRQSCDEALKKEGILSAFMTEPNAVQKVDPREQRNELQ